MDFDRGLGACGRPTGA